MNSPLKRPKQPDQMMSPIDWQVMTDLHLQDAVFVLINGKVTYTNRAGVTLLKAQDRKEVEGLAANALLHFSRATLLQSQLHSDATQQIDFVSECCHCKTLDGELVAVEARLSPLPHHTQHALMLTLRNLTTQPVAKSSHLNPGVGTLLSANRRASLAQEALHHEKEILEMIALDKPLTQILQDVCDRMERLLDNASICSIMLLDPHAQTLQIAAAPSMPSDFLKVIDTLKMPLSTWLDNVNLEANEVQIDNDLNHSNRWSELSISPTHFGFYSCWSVPIKTAFNVLLGTVDVYHPIARVPCEDEQAQILDAMHIIALAIDKKNMESSLATSEDRYRSVVTHLTEGIMVIAPGGKILTCNPSAQRILKIADVSTAGRRHRYFKRIIREDGSDIQLGEDPASIVFRTGEAISNLSLAMQLHDNSIAWLLINIQPITHNSNNNKVDAVLISFTDTTEVRETERQLQYIATHDALTGLPNRHQLQQRLSHALAHNYDQKIAIIFLDLDHFKNVNDTAGHAAGDALLCDVAKRLNSCIRATDMLARLGGDEFVIVAESFETAQHLQELADRILIRMSEPFVIEENQYHLGTSIGISIFPHDGTDGPTLLRCADSAMYLAKERGRNNYQFFTSELMIRAQHRYSLEKNIRRALIEDEFLVYFQPKVSLLSSRIVGAEALIRWKMPDIEIIEPNEFIPFSEEIGLILPIGRWVLAKACKQAQQWREQFDPNFIISVNISPKQFQDPYLPKFIQSILAETQLPASALQLEITEGLLMGEAELLISVFNAIRDLGISISLDDFGTGFSSLSYLQRFPIDNLKIDRSFIRKIPESQDSVVLTRAIIAMASALGMTVTAEGVESLAQSDFLKEAGCHEMQGYYFSMPVPANAFEALLQAQIEQPKLH